MKKSLTIPVFLLLVAVIAFSAASCQRGTGCPMNENAHVQPNKKGKYAKAKTRSGLFPKNMKVRSR